MQFDVGLIHLCQNNFTAFRIIKNNNIFVCYCVINKTGEEYESQIIDRRAAVVWDFVVLSANVSNVCER